MNEWVIILQQCSRHRTNAARESCLRQFILCFLSPLISICLGSFDISTRCTYVVSRVQVRLLVCRNLRGRLLTHGQGRTQCPLPRWLLTHGKGHWVLPWPCVSSRRIARGRAVCVFWGRGGDQCYRITSRTRTVYVFVLG